MNPIFWKHHLANFIGVDVLKEPGLYYLQESYFIKLSQCCRFLVCVTGSVAHCGSCCSSCRCQKQLKKWHKWLQGRGGFWHCIMSSVLSWPPATRTLPCQCISLFTFEWQQPPNPETERSTQNLTRCSRNQCGSHHSWFLSHSVELPIPRSLPNAEDCPEIKSWLEWEEQALAGKWFLGNAIIGLFQKLSTNSKIYLQIILSFPCSYLCSQSGTCKSSQTLSTPILTAPRKDLPLVYMVIALLKTGWEPGCGHSSIEDFAEEVGAEKVE